jgi:hypothetical protein
MCQGRCVCGYSGSHARVQAHQLQCAAFAAAYRADPAAVGTVQEEHERYQREGRRAERADAHEKSVAETDARRAAMARRFATVDLLEG